jgi:predicted Holliday junction resolvase-like endonuclease
MIILKEIFILYLEVCATVCTVQFIAKGFEKVDKYITKRRKAKEEANKPVVVEEEKEEKKDTFEYSEELQKFIQEVKNDSAEFRKSAEEFIENSNRYQEECRKLLALNDEHIAILTEREGVK